MIIIRCPKVDDLFATLLGGENLMKLDLAFADQQLEQNALRTTHFPVTNQANPGLKFTFFLGI